MGLKLTDLSCGYGDNYVVRNVDMCVKNGEITTVIGPNGSGKSTLLKGISGQVTLRDGSVIIDGEEIADHSVFKRIRSGIAVVPQVANVFSSLTVKENLEIGGVLLGKKQREERLDYLAKNVSIIADNYDKKAGMLSGGQRQIIAFYRALMLDPKVILCDEPTAGLAPITVRAVLQELLQIKNRMCAVLLVEQNVESALDVSDEVHVLVEGKLVHSSKPEMLKDKSLLKKLFFG